MSISERLFNRALKKAERLGENAEKKDIQKIEKNLEKMKRGPVEKIWETVLKLYEAFRSPDIPHKTKIVILGALLYLIVPLDIIPDVLLPAGFLDDVAVIAFIYSQCKDLIEKTIPKLAEQIKSGVESIGDESIKQIDRLTDESILQTLGKKFKRYTLRIFLNSVLKLLLCTLAILLVHFSLPASSVALAKKDANTSVIKILFTSDWTLSRGIAFFLLTIVFFWTLVSLVNGVVRLVKFSILFLKNYQIIKIRESQNSLLNKNYASLHFQDIVAESLYTTFAEQNFQNDEHKKLYAFIFRKWNEGSLPKWVPGKLALAEHVWNVLKIRIIIFVVFISFYIILYNIFVKAYFF